MWRSSVTSWEINNCADYVILREVKDLSRLATLSDELTGRSLGRDLGMTGAPWSCAEKGAEASLRGHASDVAITARDPE